MVGRDTPEPNARGDCTDLAAVAGSGQRSENPPALAVGSCQYTPNLREWGRAGGTPIKVFNNCNGKRNVHWENSVKIYANWQKNYRVLLDTLK